jgi:hypothetical protein
MAKKVDIKKENIVNGKLDLKATVYTLFTALFLSFIVCILAGMLFGWTMHEAWAPLLPGFVWPVTPGGFLIGALWIIGYSIYFGVLIVLPYNKFLKRKEK